MKVLITGASSYVGAAIYSELKKKFNVVGTYNSNQLFAELKPLDITKEKEVNNFVLSIKPDIIVHAAANASGSWCEKNPEKAVAINEKGTKYISDAAIAANSKIIFISSFAASDFKSLYGRTKSSGEGYVKKVKAGYIILRPSLIVGLSPNTVNDRPFNRMLKNITEHTEAVYDTSWKFQPTYLRHICEVITEIIERGIINETIPIAVPEMKTRFEIARDILSDFGVNVKSEDKNDKQPAFMENLEKLKRLKLREYSYNQILVKIRQEIKSYLDAR